MRVLGHRGDRDRAQTCGVRPRTQPPTDDDATALADLRRPIGHPSEARPWARTPHRRAVRQVPDRLASTVEAVQERRRRISDLQFFAVLASVWGIGTFVRSGFAWAVLTVALLGLLILAMRLASRTWARR